MPQAGEFYEVTCDPLGDTDSDADARGISFPAWGDPDQRERAWNHRDGAGSRISHWLCALLRHNGPKIEANAPKLRMDSGGWVLIRDLLPYLRRRVRRELPDQFPSDEDVGVGALMAIVAANDKRRFQVLYR